MTANAREIPRVRFKLNLEKCIQGISFLAKHRPGITQYYVGKVFFFADREHLLDWGRPISGDRYVAMEHGPVPSTIYDLLKSASGEPDEILEELSLRVRTVQNGNKIEVYPRADIEQFNFPALSQTDKDYLLEALNRYGRMSFTEVKRISHQDRAYDDAWSQPGLNNEMDVRLWFDDEPNKLSELVNTGPLRRSL